MLSTPFHNVSYGPLIGRLFIGLLFLLAGASKIAHFDDVVNVMLNNGILYAQPITLCSLVIEILGGLMIIFGWYTRLASSVMMILLCIVTIVVHHFWSHEFDYGATFQDFFRNLAIIGGLILLVCYGPGTLSLDALHHGISTYVKKPISKSNGSKKPRTKRSKRT